MGQVEQESLRSLLRGIGLIPVVVKEIGEYCFKSGVVNGGTDYSRIPSFYSMDTSIYFTPTFQRGSLSPNWPISRVNPLINTAHAYVMNQLDPRVLINTPTNPITPREYSR